MKTELVECVDALSGVKMVITHDDGTMEEKTVPITKDELAYELPENPTGRKWVFLSKFEKRKSANFLIEPRTSRNSSNDGSAPVKVNTSVTVDAEKYLEPNEFEMFKNLLEKISNGKQIATLKARIEEWQNKLDTLSK